MTWMNDPPPQSKVHFLTFFEGLFVHKTWFSPEIWANFFAKIGNCQRLRLL